MTRPTEHARAAGGALLAVLLLAALACAPVDAERGAGDAGSADALGAVTVDAGGADTLDAGAADGNDAGPRSLTAVTLNTHSFQEGADSLTKLEQIGAGLAALGADLVGLNEVMSGTFWSYDYNGATYDGTATIKEALESASGEQWHAHGVGFAHWDTGEEMANVVLSRFPIVEGGSRSLTTTDFWPAPDEQRNVVYARVQVPGLGAVSFFCTHAWGWDSADTSAQVEEVKAYMAEVSHGDEALDLLVGDLNMPSTWDGYSAWLQTPPFQLLDTYAIANPGGLADPSTWDGPHRIDYIMAGAGTPLSEDLSGVRSSMAFDGTDHEGLTLPRVSDHFAVVTVFSLR